jgi:hypothetical protein
MIPKQVKASLLETVLTELKKVTTGNDTTVAPEGACVSGELLRSDRITFISIDHVSNAVELKTSKKLIQENQMQNSILLVV